MAVIVTVTVTVLITVVTFMVSDILNGDYLMFSQRNLMEYYSAVDVSNMITIFARYFVVY